MVYYKEDEDKTNNYIKFFMRKVKTYVDKNLTGEIKIKIFEGKVVEVDTYLKEKM